MDPRHDPSADPEPTSRRASLLLGIGMVAGLLAAAYGLLAPSNRATPGLPADAVAVVNGDVILQSDYDRLLAGFARDARNPIDEEARRHVLDRMIEEELLVQRALELGLAQVDRRVRADLTSSLIASVVATAEEHDPSPQQLQAFYRDEAEFFAHPGRVRVEQILFRIPRGADEALALEKALTARQALADGRTFEEVSAEYGDEPISALPDTLLPAKKLREYIGPTALKAALALAPGEISQPVRSGIGLRLLHVIEARPTVTPLYEDIEPQIRSEWVRRAGDRALRDYLDQLRADGDVRVR